MEDIQLKELFKILPERIQSSSLNNRQLLFKQLDGVPKLSLPDVAVKELFNILKLTLHRYNDNKSRFLVENFIANLLQHQPNAINYFINLVSSTADDYAKIHSSRSMARTCLTVLSWSCVKSDVFKAENHDVTKLINAQSQLLFSINDTRCHLLDRKAYKKLCSMWQNDKGLLIIFADNLTKLEASSAVLILWFHLFKYLAESKEIELPKQLKVPALDLFCKIILSSKTKITPSVLKSSTSLLQYVTHEEFQNFFLPALQKALLRNPEVILETVGQVISGVSLDLSQYALELGKSIGTQLYSKDDKCREEAITACQYLAQQCSNPEVLTSVLKHLFAVLNGSEGKLTVVMQRQGILSGIGSLSHHAVSGSSSLQALNEFATTNFIGILKQEIHEGTVVHTIKMMSLWCRKFTEKIPDSLMDWFQTAIGQKTATPLIRASYFKCMCSAFHGNTLFQALDIVSVLNKALERAIAQPTQVSVVAEGLIASCLILQLYTCDLQAETKLKSQVSILQDTEKLPIISEKFLALASEDVLYYVPMVLERLVLDHYTPLLNRMHPVNTAMLFCLLHSSREIRQHAKTVTRKLISVLGGSEFARMLLLEFPNFTSKMKISAVSDNNNTDAPEEQKIVMNSSILVEGLITLCSGYNLDSNDIITLGVESIFPAHLPPVVARMPHLWELLLQKLKAKPETFAKDQSIQIQEKTVYCEKVDPTVVNCIKTLVRIAPNAYIPLVMDHVISILKNPSLNQVTNEEYAIYCTPQGQLYDTFAIENLKEDIVEVKNIKRESKLYSYKEQMEEIALRKELEAKKKSKAKQKKPELTKKQQEAFIAQLAKETEVRQKIIALDLEFKKAITLLLSVAVGNKTALCQHMSSVLQHLMPLLSSPLCAEEICRSYLELRHCVLDRDIAILGHSIAYVVLRVLKPACNLDPEWLKEDLKSAIHRVIETLYQRTCNRPTSGENYDETFSLPGADENRLSGPTFAYFYPLINFLLLSSESSENLIVKCLQLVSTHVSTKVADISGTSISDLPPENLPYKQILSTLTQVIGNSSNRVQQLAGKVLLDVSISISGLPGCAKATMNEIQVLLSGLQSAKNCVRESCLQSLTALVVALPRPDSEFGLLVLRRIWVAQFDKVEETKALATTLWKEAKFQPKSSLCSALLLDVTHPEEVVRESAAEALTAALEEFPELVPSIIKQLLDLYQEKLQLPPPLLDGFGRLIMESPPDNWEPRGGIALALGSLAKFINDAEVSQLVSFFVPNALGDRHPMVRKLMLDAAKAIIDEHGADSVNSLLPIFEDFLDKAPDSSSYDAVRQSVVILMGTLARHLEKTDTKVKPIVAKLIATLSTPSEQVQDAVANCLHPLVPSIKEDAPALVQKLLLLLLDSENYGERRGAAYGLAGLVKGLGILSLKQLEIMHTLTEAIQDKKNYRHREGSLFALEMLCTMLGRLFEPYIVHVLPHLLLCFGDGNQFVREATDNTAKAVMSKLSAHGVKLVLPSLLAALEEDSWRTKAGSVELLGAMAFCAPKQLSSCLPSIVPKLIEVLSDSHMKVQKAGAQALKQIGSVIRNPEIQAIVPELLDALQDPSKKTSSCLSTLLNTRFIHFIDAPSLALIMPVVQRSFQDRSTWTRKMAAQIIGNMYSLTDQKDLSPYLPTIIPGLKQSLLDPVPEVRSVSARALGALVKGMGDTSYEDLLPWLMQTLTSESSPVDRSGAAQGLSEVMGSLGVEYLHKRMPEIIATAERNDIAPHVKDGYIMMFIYLPGVFTKEFTPYIGQIINPILKALADENEFVRDTALKAGQRIVNMYAETAIMLLLPELEKGLFDENWRIRYSSVQLLGDLLYKISGVSGKMSTETADEDDNFGTEYSHKAILFALGGERRNRVLAGLYMGRSDVALLVRQAALHVWKVVVTNTPRTLREILPTLFSLLLGCLASNSYDKRQVAARTLGDLVRKLGERVLPEIIPILEKGLNSERADQRQGVCIGLSEIMTSTSKEMVLTFVDSLVPTVKRALTDPLPEVRQAAAKTFDSLHSTVGVRALDDIIPPLLQQLSNPNLAEFTLDGLRQVMAIKSKVVLPYLVPQLTTPPVNTKALSLLSTVAGDALTKHLNKILPALLLALSSALNTPSEGQELDYCQAVVLSVTDEQGVRMIIDSLLEASRQDSPKDRHAAVALLCAYCSHTKADISTYVAQLLRGLIHLFTDTNQEILLLSWETLNAVIKSLDATEQLQHVIDIRQAVRFAVSDLKGQALLPGFCLPKGITPILPVFRDAILNGSPELKEQAAQGLGEVIKLTSAEALKPSVVHITGPLIRILGDRFSWNVKVAILETLALLLEKVGVMLKPFLPQLQTTFLKALGDGHRLVRLRAATALSHLIIIHTRCDPLFTELHTAVRNTEDCSVKETMLHALRCVVTPAGDKMSEPIRKSVTATLASLFGTPDDSCRVIAAGCLGALCKWLPEDEMAIVTKEYLLDDDPTRDWILRHGKSIALMIALKEAAKRLVQPEWTDKLTSKLIDYMGQDRMPITLSAVKSTGYFFAHLLKEGIPCPQPLITVFARSMNHSLNEVKQVVALTCNFLGKCIPSALPGPMLKSIIPMLVNGTKEKNTVVKANSEYALVTLLHLRSADDTQQSCLALLDVGARDALQDVISKVLRKVAAQPEPKEEELDDTLLT